MIITGDPSQVDLPPGQTSGLAEAVRLLADVEGIGHVVFTRLDVIRHDLVAKIVAAYDRPRGTRPVEKSVGKTEGKADAKADLKASGQE
jgi:phosphate starvation-inducible PhoH-like protein